MSVFSREYASPKTLLLHEVMHLRVDPLNDGHQIVQNMFGVVHSWVHEVPKRNTGLFSRLNNTKNSCLSIRLWSTESDLYQFNLALMLLCKDQNIFEQVVKKRKEKRSACIIWAVWQDVVGTWGDAWRASPPERLLGAHQGPIEKWRQCHGNPGSSAAGGSFSEPWG